MYFFVGCVRIAWYMLTYCRLGDAFSNNLYVWCNRKILTLEYPSALRAEPRILFYPMKVTLNIWKWYSVAYSFSYLLIVVEFEATWLSSSQESGYHWWIGGLTITERVTRWDRELCKTTPPSGSMATHAHLAIKWHTTHSMRINVLTKTLKILLNVIGIILWHKHMKWNGVDLYTNYVKWLSLCSVTSITLTSERFQKCQFWHNLVKTCMTLSWDVFSTDR